MKTFLRAVALILGAAAALAQSPAAQTCSVAGTVFDEAGQPVSTVMLVVVPVDEQKWAAGKDAKTIQWTPADVGSFKITGLPPGDYKLAVTQEKIGDAGPDDALLRTLSRRGFPLSLAAGEQAQLQMMLNADRMITRVGRSGTQRAVTGADAAATLPAGPGGRPGPMTGVPPPPPGGPGAISGTVTDADGKPVAGAYIQSFIPIVRYGVTQYGATGQSAVTDEQGVYHLTGLTPREVVVAAVARSTDFSAPGAPSTSRMPPPAIGPNGRKTGYVTTYYPGTDIAPSAKRVLVGATEITGIDFALQRQPLVDVSGTFTGQPILPLDNTVNLLPGGQTEGAFLGESRRATVDRDGHFVFTDVPYGPYAVTFTTPNGWAHESITVGAATEPLTIALKVPLVVKGRVEFLGDMAAPAAETLKPFRVRLSPAVIVSGARTFEVPIQPSGEFTFRGVPAGRYVIQSRTTPPWTELSGKLGGADTLDSPIEITADRDDAVVVLVDREAGISGTVKEEGDAHGHDALVVVYSADRQYWTPATRRVRISRIVAGSGFSVSSLPPGQYFAFALPLAPDTPAVNNALLERYQSQAQRFALVAREHKTIEIRMIR